MLSRHCRACSTGSGEYSGSVSRRPDWPVTNSSGPNRMAWAELPTRVGRTSLAGARITSFSQGTVWSAPGCLSLDTAAGAGQRQVSADGRHALGRQQQGVPVLGHDAVDHDQAGVGPVPVGDALEEFVGLGRVDGV